MRMPGARPATDRPESGWPDTTGRGLDGDRLIVTVGDHSDMNAHLRAHIARSPC